MIRTSAIAGLLAGAVFVFAAPAQAADDPITAPIEALLAPVLGPGTAAPAPAATATPKSAVRHRAGHQHATGRHHIGRSKQVASRGKAAGGYAKAAKPGRKQAALAKRGRNAS